jgi:hypothetical protein
MSNLVWCVQLGIMIHFEMMFSDCDYSNAVNTTMETGFLDNVREEITHQVRRNHTDTQLSPSVDRALAQQQRDHCRHRLAEVPQWAQLLGELICGHDHGRYRC